MCGTLLPTKNLYSLVLHSIHAKHVLTVQHTPNLETLHCHLGHMNYQTLRDMIKNQKIPGMTQNLLQEDPPKCEFCVLGKQTKTPVPKFHKEGPGHRATRKLEKVCVDLSSSHVKLRTGNEHIMNIADNYMSRVWPILLKKKSEAFNYLIAWECAHKLEPGLKVGTYITDNRKLKSNAMHDWLASRGTTHLFMVPYTSVHIGHVKWMHQTLMARAWTMPYIREISCSVFVLIQNKHNPKIYERSLECIHVCYDKDSKSYCCYHRETKHVFSSYHIQFLESCDGHSPSPPEDPPGATSLKSIVKSTTPTPIFYDNNEEELLYNDLPQINPTLQNEIPPQNKIHSQNETHPQNNPPPPIETLHWHSNCIAEKPPIPSPSWLEKAIQDSNTTATRAKIARAEWKKTLQDLWEETQNEPKIVEDAAIKELCQAFRTLNLREGKAEQVDQVLSAISKMRKIDASNLEFKDKPRTWEEAQCSTDAKHWEEGYKD